MNKNFKYILLLTLACFIGKVNAQELKNEVFSLLNLDYPGLEKVKALHQRKQIQLPIMQLLRLRLLLQHQSKNHHPNIQMFLGNGYVIKQLKTHVY